MDHLKLFHAQRAKTTYSYKNAKENYLEKMNPFFFTFMWPCIITNFFIIKLDVQISQIYFVMKIYMFRTVRLSIIRSLFSVHSTMLCHTGL